MNRATLMKGSEMAFNRPPPPDSRIVINVNRSVLRAPLLHAQRAHVTGSVRTTLLGALAVTFSPSDVFPADQRSAQRENLY